MIQNLRRLARPILALAKKKKLPLQVFIRAKKGLLVRFANNGVHQNGFQDLLTYSLRVMTGEGPVYVESGDFSGAGIRSALDVIASGAKQSPGLLRPRQSTLAGPRNDGARRHPRVKEFFPFSLEKTPELAARVVEEGLRLIRREHATANGYFSAYQRFFYLRDPRGTELFHPATAVRFGVTVRKGPAKNYFSFYHPDPKKLHVGRAVGRAMELIGEASEREVTLRPGDYECVFSPRALLELFDPLRRHFDRRLCEDGKSVLSGRLGKKIFSPAFSLQESLQYPGQFGVPFDAEGAARRPVTLVKGGVLKDLLGKGHSTRGFTEHPFNPQNLVVEKGRLSLKNIFEKIRRGVFINKIWYHTLVKESEMEVTGLGAAGCFYIEKGRIVGSVPHLRYHDSLFSILRSVAGATQEQILLKDGEMGSALFPYLWVSRLRLV